MLKPCLKCGILSPGSYCPIMRVAGPRGRGGKCEHESLTVTGAAASSVRGVATEVDHRIPVADGGTDQPSNVQAVCARCRTRLPG